MKKIILSIVALMGLVVLPMGVVAQTNATDVIEDVTTRARIIVPITLTKTNGAFGLDFGAIVKGANIVSLSSAGIRSSAAPDRLVTSDGGSVPTFSVSGEPSQVINVTYPATINIDGVAGGSLTATLADNAPAGLDESGDATFAVYGSLELTGTEVAGIFSSATFDVTVSYN